MRAPPAPGEDGFTLVEMLVALTIFALLAAAGVGLLRSSVDTQAAVDRRLAALGSVGRLHALLASDLSQAVKLPALAGQPVAASFTGSSSGFQLIRTGWVNLSDAPRSNLQRVAWQASDDGLQRSGSERLDDAQQGIGARLGRSLGRGQFRYRRIDGSWTTDFASSPMQALPTAVEVTFAARPGPVTMIFALPPQVAGGA